MEQNLSLESVVVVSSDQVSCDLAGESAVLQISSGVYYSLNEIGTRVWHLIQTPCTIRGVCQILMEEFETNAERCQRETITMLEKLVGFGLVEVRTDVIA